jgi:hypothetical protein
VEVSLVCSGLGQVIKKGLKGYSLVFFLSVFYRFDRGSGSW